MPKFNQLAFNEFVVYSGAVGFFQEPIKLNSGRMSNWYVNYRKIAGDVYLMDKLTDFVLDFVQDLNLNVDCFYGVPEGATKLGVLTQFKWAKKQSDYGFGKYPLSMGRGKAKDHGAPEDKYFVGMPRGKVVLLEDVTTTGKAVLETIDKLAEAKINVIAAIGMTNRNERRDDGKTVADAVAEKGVKYFAMSNALDLLPLVCQSVKPNAEIVASIKDYFDRYGAEKINL